MTTTLVRWFAFLGDHTPSKRELWDCDTRVKNAQPAHNSCRLVWSLALLTRSPPEELFPGPRRPVWVVVLYLGYPLVAFLSTTGSGRLPSAVAAVQPASCVSIAGDFTIFHQGGQWLQRCEFMSPGKQLIVRL